MSYNTILATAPLTATGYHLKATGTALGQSLIWDNGTNVGIGNTNTSYTLDVSGTGRFTSTLLVSGAATFSSTVNVNGATATTNLNVLGVAGTMVGTTATNQQLRITAPTTTANAGAGIRFDASSGAKEATANIGVVNNATGNTGSLVFNVYNGGADFPEQMRITSAGYVGIGTSSPNTWATNLVVYNNQLTITGGGYDGSFADSIFFGGNSEGTNYRNKISNSLSSNVVNQKMKFSIASGATTFVDVMTLVGNGNVGIGTTSPAVPLQVQGASTGTLTAVTFFTDNSSNQNGLAVRCGTGRVDLLATFAGSAVATDLTFTPTTVGGAQNEAMRITSGGVVQIAGLTSNGTVSTQSSNGSLYVSSDANLKIEDGFVENGLGKVLALKPRYFYWKDKEAFSADRQLGFYAQEVNAVSEETANTPPEGCGWGIYDRGLVALLTSAIQEQQATITELTEKVNRLYIHHYGE